MNYRVPPGFQNARRAFSLIELLVVMAMIAVLASLSLAGFSTTGAAAKVRHGADVLATHGMWARQHAATRAACTALVVRGSGGNDASTYRAVSIHELTPRSDGSPPTSSDWKQVSRWEFLPQGVVIDPGSYPGSLFTSPRQSFNPALPDPTDAGGGDYRVIYFGPDGRLVQNESPALRLIQGVIENGDVVATGARSGSEPANSIDLVFVAATGQTIVREQK